MNIELRDILTINNKEYVVCSKMFYQGEKYIYLVNLSDNTDIKFCLIKEDKIFEVFNEEVIKALIIQINDNLTN